MVGEGVLLGLAGEIKGLWLGGREWSLAVGCEFVGFIGGFVGFVSRNFVRLEGLFVRSVGGNGEVVLLRF